MSDVRVSDTSMYSRALLIDLDNCPAEPSQLSAIQNEFARIIVCFGGIEPKVPLGLVIALATAIHEGKIELIGMQKGGKNAADFGLAFWAGRLVSEMPEVTKFTILSADADLDHVVNMLRTAGREAERQSGHRWSRQSVLSSVEDVLDEEDAIEDAVDHFIAMLLSPNKPRPAKRASLINSIKAASRAEPWKGIAPGTILNVLLKRQVLRFGQKGKVSTCWITIPTVVLGERCFRQAVMMMSASRFDPAWRWRGMDRQKTKERL
ncbi:MAG: hypothetical protein HQL64_16320 [Magnetococcales bacterium]|nr:hypothetical protein [Magnetococcales bacterium]